MENRLLVLLASCLAFICPFALAEHGVTFIYPIKGLTLNYLDTINVTWTSNFSSPQLFTFCTNETDSSLITEQDDQVSPYNASALVVLKYLGVSTCYFDLRPNSSAGFGANSPSFTLLPVLRSQTTIGLGSQISPTDTPSSNSTTTAPAAITTVTRVVTPPVTPLTKPSPIPGGKAIAGVGLACLILLFIALGALFWWWRRRRINKALAVSAEEAQQLGEPNNTSSMYQRHELHQPPPELPGPEKHELPTTVVSEIG